MYLILYFRSVCCRVSNEQSKVWEWQLFRIVALSGLKFFKEHPISGMKVLFMASLYFWIIPAQLFGRSFLLVLVFLGWEGLLVPMDPIKDSLLRAPY